MNQGIFVPMRRVNCAEIGENSANATAVNVRLFLCWWIESRGAHRLVIFGIFLALPISFEVHNLQTGKFSILIRS